MRTAGFQVDWDRNEGVKLSTNKTCFYCAPQVLKVCPHHLHLPSFCYIFSLKTGSPVAQGVLEVAV